MTTEHTTKENEMQTQLAQLKITENLAKAAEHLRIAIEALESGLFVSTAESAESCVVSTIKPHETDNFAVRFTDLWEKGLTGYPLIPCSISTIRALYYSSANFHNSIWFNPCRKNQFQIKSNTPL